MLEEFSVIFKEDGFDAMTPGAEYLVTYNGCHHGSYRGHDDNGTAFCYSDDVFEPRPLRMLAVPGGQAHPYARPMHPPIDSPTHKGVFRGIPGHHYTQGREYDLIYESMSNSVAVEDDRGNWHTLDGNEFHVIHNYSDPQAHIAPDPAWDAAADAIFDGDGGMTDMPAPPLNVTATEVIARNTKTAPRIEHEPESTEELREYRFKPNLF